MSLVCLKAEKKIITDRLAVQIDLSDENSWDLNSGLTSISLNKWSGAVSDNINLFDFGLTAYDNGRVDQMYSGLTLTPSDTKLELYRVGFNNETGGTFYDGYEINPVTTGSTLGNYFDLNGGYLQGFFKLQDYNYEILPARYGDGVTIETIFRVDQDSQGILLYLGARAEDKYNPFFSGETKQIEKQVVTQIPLGVVGRRTTIVETVTEFSGVTTSEENNLNAFLDKEVKKEAFSSFENSTDIVPEEQPRDSINNNVIALGVNPDKTLFIRRVDENGLIKEDVTANRISTGWTILDLVFAPDETLEDDELKCADRRTGDLFIYVNGRKFFKLEDFEEFIFTDLKNHREKTLGVPYSISWGGGSFGLKHSYHWDIKEVSLYNGEDTIYINENFEYKDFPLDEVVSTGNTIGGVVLSADDTTFIDDNTGDPVVVMEIRNTGTTATTNSNKYYIEYDNLIPLISNRDYEFSLDIYDTGIFAENSNSKISLSIFGTEDIAIINETFYKNIIREEDLIIATPFPIIKCEFEYSDSGTGLIIDGSTGLPVGDNIDYELYGITTLPITGEKEWKTISAKYAAKENTALNNFRVGILIESDMPLNEDFILYVDNFKYSGSDGLAQDNRKRDLTIEQNFDSSYIGGIQKLRIYDTALNANEVLHNASVESSNNNGFSFTISTGGRIINRQ
jgi:hypothetical protein